MLFKMNNNAAQLVLTPQPLYHRQHQQRFHILQSSRKLRSQPDALILKLMDYNNNIERHTMLDVLGLQWKLTQARNENQENRASWHSSGNGNYNNSSSINYKSRTASITREQQDERERRKQMIQREVIQLFDEGYNVDQVSYFLESYASSSEVARIAEYNQRRRKFLMTGKLDLPGQVAGITIG
jgi:hypothetical protein